MSLCLDCRYFHLEERSEYAKETVERIRRLGQPATTKIAQSLESLGECHYPMEQFRNIMPKARLSLPALTYALDDGECATFEAKEEEIKEESQ